MARYPEAKVLASGWLLGEKLLAGRSRAGGCEARPGPRDAVRHAAAVSRPELPDVQVVFQCAACTDKLQPPS